MNIKLILLVIFNITIVSSKLNAQTGPGGVENTSGSSDLSLWLDANKISQANGSNVSTWTDQSGYSNTATAPVGREPYLYKNALNSKPVVRFRAENIDYLKVSDAVSLKPNKVSVFVVGSYSSKSGNGDGWGVFVIKTDNSSWLNGYGLGRKDRNQQQLFYINRFNGPNVVSAMNYNTPSIMTGIYDKTDIEFFLNELSKGTKTYSADISNSANYLYVGAGPKPNGTSVQNNLDGDIAEVIIIKRDVNDAERIIINNYLSAKYGISITHDYYSYQANYGNKVVGIGRVDASNTHLASMSDGILQIESASSIGNNEFLFFGHDNASISSWTTTEAPSVGHIERIAREWRLDETGDVGTISFRISNANLPGLNAGYTKYGVMVDADGNFSSGAKVYELTQSGSYYMATGIDIDDGDYVSIAAIKPIIEFADSSSSTFESNSLSAEVILNYITSSTVSVNYATSNGTALAGSDYTATSGILNITAGNSSNNISVSVTNDVSVESDEDFDITISSPSSGINLGTKTTHTHTINDDDNLRKINFDVSTASGNESSSVNVGVSISSADANNDTKVDYSVTGGTAIGGGTDFTLASGTITIAAGASTTGSFAISINNDVLDEDNETIVVSLSNPVNCNLGNAITYTYTINDDDASPSIQFRSTNSSGAESVANKTIQIDLSAVSSKDVSVNIGTSGTATENTDYTKSSSSITITAGNTNASISLTINDDDTEENDETATLTLSGSTNASLGTNTSHTYTILDNDTKYGPGGVRTGLKFWVKSDAGITSFSGNVSQWDDQSGSGNDASQSTSAYRPSIFSDRLNYQKSLYFDGTNEHLNISDLIASGNTKVTIVAVGTNETGGDTWHSMVIGQAIGTWVGGGYGLAALNGGNTSFGFWVNNYQNNAISTTWLNQAEQVLIGQYDGSNLKFFMNSKLIGTDAYSGTIGDIGTTHIGGSEGTKFNHKGYISEVAIYDQSLSPTNLKMLNSYLAIKYGITLNRISMSSNYYNSNFNSVYLDAGTYWNSIIGIGRDDGATLYQKQSKQSDDSTRLYISNLANGNSFNVGSFSSNNQFVIMGNDAKQLCATTTSNAEIPAAVNSRLEREWKITNTAFSGTYSIQIVLNSKADVNHVTVGDLRLLVDDDGDFSNANTYAAGDGLTFSYSSPTITISGISTTQIPANSTRYITIASTRPRTPLLPIQLTKFEAVKKDKKVLLKWETVSETNNDYFVVERSRNGNNWKELVKINGAGNSNTLKSYKYIDSKPFSGINYYRLKQIDFDGKYSYSQIKKIDFSIGSDIRIYPNPAKSIIIIEGVEAKNVNISIYNTLGQDVSIETGEAVAIDGKYQMNMSKLASGIYFIKIEDKFFKVVKK